MAVQTDFYISAETLRIVGSVAENPDIVIPRTKAAALYSLPVGTGISCLAISRGELIFERVNAILRGMISLLVIYTRDNGGVLITTATGLKRQVYL